MFATVRKTVSTAIDKMIDRIEDIEKVIIQKDQMSFNSEVESALKELKTKVQDQAIILKNQVKYFENISDSKLKGFEEKLQVYHID